MHADVGQVDDLQTAADTEMAVSDTAAEEAAVRGNVSMFCVLTSASLSYSMTSSELPLAPVAA
jgi:hypothetical protein